MMNTPLLTGLNSIDSVTGGFKPGELIILGARNGMGKTSFAVQLLERTGIQNGEGCYYVSLEESKQKIVEHLYMVHTGYYPALKSKCTEVESFQQQYIENGPAWINDDPLPDLDELIIKWRTLASAHLLRLIIIDYFQLLAVSDEKRPCLKRLKDIALELSVPILVLSQLSRFVEYRQNHRPILSDLSIAVPLELVDQVLLLHQEHYYNSALERPYIAEFYLAKQPEGHTGMSKELFCYTPHGFLFYDDDSFGMIPIHSRRNGTHIVVGSTKDGAEISVCDHCDTYHVPHFFLSRGFNEAVLYFEKPMLLDSYGNLDLADRMDLQNYLTPDNWSRMIAQWNEKNEHQLSPYTQIPYYINLQRNQDTAIVTTKEMSEMLGATLYVMEDQDQRPHFHYERPDGTEVCISLTEPKYFLPVKKPLSEPELDRLMNCLMLPHGEYEVSLYRRLLRMWNIQNETKVYEPTEMPNYRSLYEDMRE